MRSLALAAALVTFTACSSYNDAELACQEEFELENECRAEGGVDTYDISAEQQCASANSYLDGDDEAIAAQVDNYECAISVWNSADCSTAESVSEALDSATDCFF